MEIVKKFENSDTDLVENFRVKTFEEGNNSLSYKSFDPLNINGQIFLFFRENELASIMAVESSEKYTDEKETCRICRYHILKKHRNCNAGFKMLPHAVNWAIEKKYKLVYWTHDVNNKSLNALYQHKKIMPGKLNFFKDSLYQSFKLQTNFRFVTGKTIQFVYAKYLDENFIWNPKGLMINYNGV